MFHLHSSPSFARGLRHAWERRTTHGPAAPLPLFWGLCLLDVGLRQSRGAKVSSRRGGAATAPAPRLASHAPTPELCAQKVRPEPPGSAGSQPCSHLPGPHSFSLGEVGNLPFFLSQQQIFFFLNITFFSYLPVFKVWGFSVNP